MVTRTIMLAALLMTSTVQAQQLRDVTLAQGIGDDVMSLMNTVNGFPIAGFYTSNGVIVGQDTLYPSNGYGDMFVGLLNESLSDIDWIRSFGGNNNPSIDEYCGIAAADQDAFWVAGVYSGVLWIDGHQAIAYGNEDAFLAKFDYAGNCLWLKSVGGVVKDEAGPVVITDAGELLWFVNTSGTARMDTFNLSKGGHLMKLDINGDVISVTNQFAQDVRIISMARSESAIYFAGQTSNDTASFGSDVWTSNNIQDIFLAKTDVNGVPIWSRRLVSGRNGAAAVGMDIDSTGFVLLTGDYYDSLSIDGNTVEYASAVHSSDVFIARFDTNGVNQWIRNGRSNSAYGVGICVDGDSSFYVIGRFKDTLQLSGQPLISSSDESLFLTRYSIDGDCMGASMVEGAVGIKVVLDDNGDPIVSGIFSDSINVQGTTYVSWGNYDGFIGRMDKITGIAPEARMGQDGLVIYANPNDGTFRVKVPASVVTLQGASLRVYDARGGLVEQFELDPTVDTPILRLKHVTSGQFIVRLEQGGRVYSGKMIVE